jgi:hypothetical protein
MRLRLFAVVLLGALLALAACGGDGDDSSSGPTAASSDAATPTSEGSAGGIPSTIDATVRIASAAAAVGEQATVAVTATASAAPGVGAWTFNVAYDPAVVSVVDCPSVGTQVCNPALDERTLRMAGAVAEGLTGEATLATITFRCESAGTSALAISLEVLADATIGGPRIIDAPVEDGEVVCS